VPIEAVMHHQSATPVVAVAIILLGVAVISVLLISWLFYWRSGKR
jgi:hypothetical protein